MAAVSQQRVRRFLEEGDIATDTTAKGRALEEAVAYVFGRVPGVDLYARNAINQFGCAETDLVFSNQANRSPIGFLDWALLIECKNLARSVGNADVDYFRLRLLEKSAKSGILVAAGGISGQPGMHAFHSVETALVQGCAILVVTRADLESIRSTDDLSAILLKRYMDLKVHGTLILD